MPAIVEIIGNGAGLSYSTDDGTTFTPFAKIVDLDPGKWKAAKINSTNLASVAKTSQPGIPDYGETKLKIRYLKDLLPTIKGWLDNKTIIKLQVFVVDKSSTIGSANALGTYYAWVMEFDPYGMIKEDECIDSSITFAITGAVTLTPGS